MPTTKAPRPRTRTFTGCQTCRQRHVKCDGGRPHCKNCKTRNLACAGYAAKLKWMTNDTTLRSSYRNSSSSDHVRGSYNYTPSINVSESAISNGATGSAPYAYDDQSITEPFASDILLNSTQIDSIAAGGDIERESNDQIFAAGRMQQTADGDTLFDATNMNVGDDPPSLTQWTGDIDTGLPLATTQRESPVPPSFMFDESLFNLSSLQYADLFDLAINLDPLSDPAGPMSTESFDIIIPAHDEVLSHAPELLKYFKQNIIPLMVFTPSAVTKSSWSTLILAEAVQTHARMTFLDENASFAKKALLYAVLAAAAHHKAATDSTHTTIATAALEEAKRCLNKTLKHEKKTAKYKDQMGAIFAILACGAVAGLDNARSFMVEAELLLRRRGLAKFTVSRRCRMLHHLYTWIRILGESTYVPQNYANVVEALQSTGTGPDLDDFLRLPEQGEQDLQIAHVKDPDRSLHDIHLMDSRQNPFTMFTDFFGVSETWLSLVSQTTRLAHLLGAVTYGGVHRPGLVDMLDRRASVLEDMVCKLVASEPPSALNSALLLLFYRRIRSVNPWMLRTYVVEVLDHLDKLQDNLSGAGIVWATFLAACEALGDTRQRVLHWIDHATNETGLHTFSTIKNIATEVWRRKDEPDQSNRLYSTWPDVCRERGFWLIVCG